MNKLALNAFFYVDVEKIWLFSTSSQGFRVARILDDSFFVTAIIAFRFAWCVHVCGVCLCHNLPNKILH